MIRRIGIFVLCAAGAAAPQQAALAADPEISAQVPHIAVINREGEEIGMATFEQTPNGVLISVDIEGLPVGEHGFHIHEKGVCDPAEGFSTAGGHYAPRSHDHGIKMAAGPHAGDMSNQFVGEDLVLRAHVLNPAVTLGNGFNTLFDEDGSALMIHEGADDYTSQPSGAAGSRIACGVISPPQGE